MTGMSLVAMAAPSAIPPQMRRPEDTTMVATRRRRAPRMSMWELVTPSVAARGLQPHSAAHRGSRPVARSVRRSKTVMPRLISRPATCIGQYSRLGAANRRTPAKKISLEGGYMVGTVARLIVVQSTSPVPTSVVFMTRTPSQVLSPSTSTTGSGKSQSVRRYSSAGSAGTYS
jgi:hypothetical protein